MKGSIRQRGDNSYQVRIFRGIGGDGKKLYDAFTVKGTKKDAEKFLRDKLGEMDRGAYVGPVKMTFADHATTWLSTSVRMRVRTTTAESYETLIIKHAIPALGKMLLQKLEPPHLQRLYANKLAEGLSPRRVQYLHTVIHGCLKAAVKWGYLARNIADAVDAPRPERREAPALNPQGVERLLKEAEGHYLFPIILLAVGTGLRRGEILGLKWEDVDQERGIIRVRRSLVPTKNGLKVQEPKTSKGRRSVTLPAFVVAGLRRYRAKQAEHRMRLGPLYQDEGMVCAHEDGRPWSPDTISHAFSGLLKRAGLPAMRFHDLRHTHATLLLSQGVHPKVVQERLGHSTITITMDTYSHVMPSLQTEAAQRLDEAFPGHLARFR